MTSVERLSITLPADMARMVRDEVREGRYASNSEVIRDALRAWQLREHQRAETLAGIRQKLSEAEAETGPGLTKDEMRAHFRARRSSPEGNG